MNSDAFSAIQDLNDTNWARIHSIWVAISLLFLLWQLHYLIETIVRANTISNIRKRGYIHLPTSSSTASDATTSGLNTSNAGPYSDLIPTDWMLRIRHGGRVARNAFLVLLFLSLFVQFWMIHAATISPDPPGPTVPLPPPTFQGAGGPKDGLVWAVDEHPLFTYYVFTWIVTSITLFQVVVYLIIEPMVYTRDGRGAGGYENFGAGIYGRRHGFSNWMDFFFELLKFVSITILIISGLSLKFYYL